MHKSEKEFSIATLRWSITALLALIVSVLSVARWEGQLLASAAQHGSVRIVTYEAVGKPLQPDDERIYRNRLEDKGVIKVEYSYVTLHNDQARLSLSVDAEKYKGYRDNFGYLKSEMDDLFNKQRDNLAAAYTDARRNPISPSKLKLKYDRIKLDYEDGVKNLVLSRGLRYLSKSLLAADVPGIVKKNVKNLRSVSVSISDIMKSLDYDSNDLLGTTLPMVQTAISYSALPLKREGRMIAGFAPPLEVLLEGRGDCDSKTGLLASILLNWDKVKLVGVGVPGHYLLGFLQHPARGDAFVEYEGLTYVLMEPSGPAWVSPGIISDYTQKWLEARDGVILEELTRN